METESTQAAIEALLDEQRTFPPPEEFTAGAIVRNGETHPAAGSFIELLCGPDGQAILSRNGFLSPAS